MRIKRGNSRAEFFMFIGANITEHDIKIITLFASSHFNDDVWFMELFLRAGNLHLFIACRCFFFPYDVTLHKKLRLICMIPGRCLFPLLWLQQFSFPGYDTLSNFLPLAYHLSCI